MFKRRDKKPIGVALREFFAPRGGWRRAFEYYRHRMKRLPDSPSRIALGFACGVYTSFTPFFGFHFVFAALLAWLLRGNVLASAIGTFAGNPLTFPFIAGVSLELGSLFFDSPIDMNLEGLSFFEMVGLFFLNIHELVIPYLAGGFLPGMVCAVVSFFIVRPVVANYQKRRRARLMNRARRRIAAEAGAG
ncbi:MAG: DUF2062 domain-containing protein, partial [Pseudomonadota bacterium]